MSDAEVQCSFIIDVIAYCVRNTIKKKKMYWIIETLNLYKKKMIYIHLILHIVKKNVFDYVKLDIQRIKTHDEVERSNKEVTLTMTYFTLKIVKWRTIPQ